MFNKTEISNIDEDYFDILGSSPFQVTLKSRNTGHEWHIISIETRLPGSGVLIRSCQISHRHNRDTGFHFHGRAKTLKDAIAQIVRHDEFQMTGRKRRILKRTQES